MFIASPREERCRSPGNRRVASYIGLAVLSQSPNHIGKGLPSLRRKRVSADRQAAEPTALSRSSRERDAAIAAQSRKAARARSAARAVEDAAAPAARWCSDDHRNRADP